MLFANSEEPIAGFLSDLAAILVLATTSGALVRRLLRCIENLMRKKNDL